MQPLLQRSYKKRFPFKVGTTSFIYPENYAPNVEKLGPFVDEIELLFFEALDKVPTALAREITRLAQLARTCDLTYNVHLPIDCSLSHPQAGHRQKAVDVLLRVIDLTAVLQPASYTLHIPFTESASDQASIQRWRSRISGHLQALCRGLPSPRQLCIETLNYPIEWVLPVMEAMNVSACVDVGHLALNGFSLTDTFARVGHRTTVLHLMGVANGRDHLALSRLSAPLTREVLAMLKDFRGVVCLEVFNFKALSRSLQHLEHLWANSERAPG